MPSELRRLRILAPARYPWRFNGPRESAHIIDVRSFVPFNKISSQIEGVTLFNPFPVRGFDLIHAFNRIPLSFTPFVIGFESNLPRAFGLESTSYFRFLSKRLAGERCKKIVAISDYAARIFRATHSQSQYFESLVRKLVVRYPNMPVPSSGDPMAEMAAEPLVVTFVGSHFGRKGGCVAVKIAELARKRGIPLTVQIVSTLETGGAIWTDPPDASRFESYLKLLSLPNVHFYRGLPNAEVLSLLRKSHFSLLATFCDTFGYSAIESMMNYAPVVATCQGALPEFIRQGENGILLDLPVDDFGEWAHHQYGPRDSERYAANYFKEIERLAEEALSSLEEFVGRRDNLSRLRENARREAVKKFDLKSASAFWDALYLEAANAV